MGSKNKNALAYDNEKPQHTVDISYDYWMAKFTVTNEHYVEYLKNKEQFISDLVEKKHHPVVNISWDDAMDYCKWFYRSFKMELGELILRLPTEAEWEKAARGMHGNEWPWGDEFDQELDKTKCNSKEGGKNEPTPVGAYSAAGGDSPYGCADMVGNVWEWTHSLFVEYPYDTKDGREDEKSRNPRVLRGGSFVDSHRGARCAYRYGLEPNRSFNRTGFRVAASPIDYGS